MERPCGREEGPLRRLNLRPLGATISASSRSSRAGLSGLVRTTCPSRHGRHFCALPPELLIRTCHSAKVTAMRRMAGRSRSRTIRPANEAAHGAGARPTRSARSHDGHDGHMGIAHPGLVGDRQGRGRRRHEGSNQIGPQAPRTCLSAPTPDRGAEGNKNEAGLRPETWRSASATSRPG